MREEILILLQNTLNAHGAQSLTVSKFTTNIVTGLSDPQVAYSRQHREGIGSVMVLGHDDTVFFFSFQM